MKKEFKIGDIVTVHKTGEWSKVADGEIIKITKRTLTVKVEDWDNEIIEFNKGKLNEKGFSNKESYYYIQTW